MDKQVKSSVNKFANKEQALKIFAEVYKKYKKAFIALKDK